VEPGEELRDWSIEGTTGYEFLNGDELRAETTHGDEVRDDSFLLLFNAHFEDMSFRLPARRFGTRWAVELATGSCHAERFVPGSDVAVEARSVAVLKRV
jgi:glycogen operon protein